jgi:hypothetical protein
MDSLSPTETRIIRSIIVENFGAASPLLTQLPRLRFASRHMTGKGFFIQFALRPEAPRAKNANRAVSTDIQTDLPAPRDIVGFTLFIDDGVMTSFEGYLFGGASWPSEPMETWLILDRIGSGEQKAK